MAGGAPFVDQFARVESALGGAERLHETRTRGLTRFRKAGLPGPAVEAWKYTNLETLGQLGLVPGVTAPATLTALPAHDLSGLDAYRAVFVNGRFDAALSALDGLPRGVVVENLAAAIARDPAAVAASLPDDGDAMPMAALNTAFVSDGLVLRLARGAMLDKPLHLVSVATDGVAFHPRHLIQLEADASATVLESHIGAGAGFANHVADIQVAPGAVLKHYVLQDQAPATFHVAAVRLALAERATYEGFVLHTGARLARHELRATVGGGNVECAMAGLYLAAGEQHHDNTTFIDHAEPGSRSRQLFKGVLDDRARGVFQGRVLVRPHAQKTDAHQLSRALLLSPRAEMDGKPELEIYADDVRCSHGATIGSLDQEPMFYLMSRGIDETTAYRMLVEAFAVEAIDEISAGPVRDAFAAKVVTWLAGRSTRGAA